MNIEQQLKLQAYLDSEVTSDEARQIAALLARDSQAASVYESLRQTKAMLVENELSCKVPESRDFYWSKIRQGIERLPEASETIPSQSSRPWWVRYFVPLGAAALLALGLFSTTMYQQRPGPTFLGSLQELETPLEDTTAISFFSEQQKMTVVWVGSQDQ
jgi:anti-sigma factor RsiW